MQLCVERLITVEENVWFYSDAVTSRDQNSLSRLSLFPNTA
ncbi:unnamed protein product [Arabidopsis lyrata]|nr:unnamed protein product [Arabidopsis lyrata]